MASRGAASTDHEQILAAVVVALGKSSSKVAHCNSALDSPSLSPVESPKSSNKTQRHSHLFFCFSNSSLKTPVSQPATYTAANSKFSNNWPRSPGHIMSRLLLSPDMSPDRILIKSTASSPGGGGESPARSRFSKSHFSGPLLGMSTRKKNKSKKKGDEPSAFQNEREEPTSPKVTCMGTVKAPKKKSSGKFKSDSKFCHKPPTWKTCSIVQQQAREFHSGLLDMSRFGDKSGELRVKSGELKQTSSGSRRLSNGKAVHEQQQQHQQHQQKVSLVDCKKKSMRMLLREDDSEVNAAKAGAASGSADNNRLSLEHGLRIVACRSSSLKKPEEICLWKRRCAVEPLKLDIVGRT